ncbi:MAG TPA: fused MFS/spermidine synthase [Verrucomicrobiae bacterium]|jgi:predicted membrane-bound spermidine synthase
MILFLFFCSGATALIYEVIWSKYLTLLFGSTIEAQTVVLAVFMGGLALGNKLFGRMADRKQNPLILYGGIEISVGVYAFLFPLLYWLADAIFAGIGSRLLDYPLGLLFLKGILSAVLLLGPTILMGGTLPVLAAWLQKTTPDGGRRSARFYSTNSLGAVCGAGLAGFLLVRWVGLQTTMELSAAANVLVGVIAIGIGRTQSSLNPDKNNSSTNESPTTISTFHWSCILVALTGAVSMGLEVLASRCLALIFGASLQVFSIVLMAFILGIGLGSAIIASPRLKQSFRELITMSLLLGAAALIGFLVFNINQLATVYLYVQSGLTRTSVGYYYHQVITSIIAIFVLGLPAGALGAVLPLWIRAVSGTTDLLGDRVGRLVTWNTLGAVVGVLMTGFVLMPNIGLRGSFAILGFVLIAAVMFMALVTRRKLVAVFGLVFGVLLAMASVNGGRDWQSILSSGVFRLANMDFSQKESPLKAFLLFREQYTKLLFYEDSADATVSVEGEVTAYSTNEIVLKINGKPDASAYGDHSTQIELAQLPLMVKPDSRDVFCFGMGSGVTAGSTLGYPIDHLTIAENCEPVLSAVKLFTPWNRGVYTNDRVRIYHEDARTVLKLSPQKYDVIISEPSNPWMVGIGSVFSQEFYNLAASRLKPGGIMTQWFHLYEMDDNTMDLVLRTFASVFPNMEIWDIGDEDIVILGSKQPWETGPDVYQRAFDLPQPHDDLASIGFLSPRTVLARQLASQATAFAIPGPGPVQSDNAPILEYDAPKAFYINNGAQSFQDYDERTWQKDLAPVEKNKILAGLNLTNLAPIFHIVYGSGNLQLQSYLTDRYKGNIGSLTFGNQVMPCIFRDTNASLLVYAPPSVKTNLMVRQLYYSEIALLQSGTTQKSKNGSIAVNAIESILDGVQNYKRENEDWSAAHYADIAIKASLRFGDVTQAKAILARGLQMEPDSEQLQYLSRILARD